MRPTVYLVGYMGVGKTTIGRRLAERLTYDFLDTDLSLESRFRCSITKLFADIGEARFRLCEHAFLEEVAGMKDCIIATGGGLPCYHDNMRLMLDTGTVVYLEATDELLAERLELCKHTRPTIRDKSGDELLLHVRQAMAQRRPVYEEAHLRYRVEGIEAILDEQELVERIVRDLDQL